VGSNLFQGVCLHPSKKQQLPVRYIEPKHNCFIIGKTKIFHLTNAQWAEYKNDFVIGCRYAGKSLFSISSQGSHVYCLKILLDLDWPHDNWGKTLYSVCQTYC